MPSGSFRQADVVCPFYRSDDGKQKITCEGLVDRSSISWNFTFKADYSVQMETFCCKYPEKCEVFRMLNDIYEGE